MKKKALIFGVTGQDGIFLSELLIKKNYSVFATLRRKNNYLSRKIKLIFKKKLSEKIIFNIVKKVRPNKIYFLIGQSNSNISFLDPKKTFETNFNYFANVVEACIKLKIKPNIFYASSGEIFGSNKKQINEKTKKNPPNPYALAKYISVIYSKYMSNYYNLNISTGILFNHDSEYRSKGNLSSKIINYLNNNNFKKKLELGNIDVNRDFGLAKEYVLAMYKISQQKKRDDFIIATGKPINVRNLVKYAFKIKNLDYRKYVNIDRKKFSKSEIKFKSVNISKIKKLKWFPKYTLFDLVKSKVNS
tara:strand:+ start:382 stop:1290 length:909 start_codon:yes stop_codon:yes gene_type:complete